MTGCSASVRIADDDHFGRMVPIVFGAIALLFFARLDIPLQEPDEVRYAEVSRQMLESDSLLVPVLHGEPYLDKPPLTYWLVMASYRCFGVHDWSARLVSCLAAFLVVLATWLWARQTMGQRAALLAAVILGLSARFVQLGRLLTPDSLLCLCTVLSWMGLHCALARPGPRRCWWLASAICCGLGILTKGPVALLLVLAPVAFWLWLGRWEFRPRGRDWCLWCLVALGVAAPWYVAVSFREPEFLQYFFWKHNVQRYVAPFVHQKPFWFYLPEVLLGTLPWSLLLPGLMYHVWRRRGNAAEVIGPGKARWEHGAPLGPGFFLLAALWCLLFFSCSGSKRAAYVLPAFPPLALALGSYLSGWLARKGRRTQRMRVFFQAGSAMVFVILLLAVCHLLPGYADRFSLRGQVEEHRATAGEMPAEVVCFPRHWDSVSWYLRRQDIRAYSAEQSADMMADLRARPATLVFVKPGEPFEQFVRELPANLEFVPAGRPGLVLKGWVRERPVWGDFAEPSPVVARR